MNNKEFISRLASKSKYTVSNSQKLTDALMKELGKTFEQGTPVSISGFGTFEVKKKMERVIIHPATGKKMLVPPKLVLSFRPTPIVKHNVKKGAENNG